MSRPFATRSIVTQSTASRSPADASLSLAERTAATPSRPVDSFVTRPAADPVSPANHAHTDRPHRAGRVDPHRRPPLRIVLRDALEGARRCAAGLGLAAATALAWPASDALAAPSSAVRVPNRAGVRVDAPRGDRALTGDLVGTVADSGTGAPITGAEIAVQREADVVAATSSDAFGRFAVHNLTAGQYTIVVHLIGFRAESRGVSVADGGAVRVDVRLAPVAASLQQVQVTAAAPIAINTRTGDQEYDQNEAHSSPTTTTSQILQQSIAGAARAPTGEVHIRGQHAEYTYYIDGVPVPSGVSGSLNELFDPSVVNRIDFQTGGWDAEYGNKNAAVVNIETRVPAGGFHSELSTYGGSYGSFGQGLNVSGNTGRLGMFFSGAGQQTDMRREPIVATPSFDPVNFHNHGEDYFGFGKLQYTAGAKDLLSLDGNYARTRFGIPYDSSGGTVLNDRETDRNAFVNLAYHHRFSTRLATDQGAASELFIGPFYRHGSLRYSPGQQDTPSFVDRADDPTGTPRNVFEDRSFSTVGVKADLSFPIAGGALDGKIGTLTSRTSGSENFQLIDPRGVQRPIRSVSTLDGYDFGTYAETSIRPSDRVEIQTGLRFDSHVAPFAGNQTQMSPRIRLNFYPSVSNTVWVYFGRLFIPTNIEDLRSITFASGGADTTGHATPTRPERDAFYEAGYIHRFPLGFVGRLSGYYKSSSPGIDDNTVPGSAITTSVNIGKVHITGLEAALDFRPPGPISGYVNLAINHAYGAPPVTGGFFPISLPPTRYFDLDHDQRVSAVANVLYSLQHLYVSATGIYGTGLTNGISPDSTVRADTGNHVTGYQPGYGKYCTGLLCFNSAFKVRPSYVQDLALGYTLAVHGRVVRPEVFVDNLFDDRYLLKGAFFSGRSVGRPRTFQVRLNVAL